MYRGFYLSDFPEMTDYHYVIGSQLLESQKTVVKESLEAFMYQENVLDASKIQSNWFPTIDADVFLSHSHRDANTAIQFAGWLSETFNLNSFIDSLIWGYADDLLKLIDDKFCKNSHDNLYNYKSRNKSTGHVHMMLSTALTMMIDKTECLFFLETPSSIRPSDNLKEKDEKKTGSPWIYHELAITQLIEKKLPKRLLLESERTFSKAEKFQRDFDAIYSVDLSHMAKINTYDLELWELKVIAKKNVNALDVLYKIIAAPKRSNVLNS